MLGSDRIQYLISNKPDSKLLVCVTEKTLTSVSDKMFIMKKTCHRHQSILRNTENLLSMNPAKFRNIGESPMMPNHSQRATVTEKAPMGQLMSMM